MKPNAKILLVEDDPAIVSTLCRVLADEGYTVVVERRGDTGLTRAKNIVFDAVITDLKLPGLDGLELVRDLHATHPRPVSYTHLDVYKRQHERKGRWVDSGRNEIRSEPVDHLNHAEFSDADLIRLSLIRLQTSFQLARLSDAFAFGGI